MKLYLVRHAIAETGSLTTEDSERGLTEAGKTKMARAAQGLRKMKVRPDVILTSPLRRAHETAQILAAEMPGADIEVLAELAPGAKPASVVAALRPYSARKALALVGHQPDLSYLASFLLTGSQTRLDMDFKKGAVACFQAEFSEDPAHCTLEWFVTPKLLRSL
jgi:phosphohistidine phosphatase